MKQSNNHNRPNLPYYTNNESVPFYTGPEYEFLDNDFDDGCIPHHCITWVMQYTLTA